MVLIVTIMSNNDNDDTLSPPAFSSVLAMPSRPKAWFWHSTDLQPWSVGPVAVLCKVTSPNINPAVQAFNYDE